MVPRYAYWVVALLSASLLAYEVLLTRVCALRLHFHFGFLIVSNCLLGIGMSGTLLTATEARWRRAPRTWIWRSAAAYVASLVVTWMLLRSMAVPDSVLMSSPTNVWRFVAFNLAAAIPFMAGGTAVGLLLAAYAARIHAVYAADLLGAGAGCVAIPILLWHVGAGGCFLLLCVLGLGAFALAAPPRARGTSFAAAGLAAAVCLGLTPWFDRAVPMPGKGYLDLTNEVRRVLYAPNYEFSRWSANSRIDMLALRPEERFMFCRGAQTLHLPMADQKLILQDGSAGTIVSNFSEEPWGNEPLMRSLYALTFSLTSRPRVLIIGLGGGNDAWAAKLSGAQQIVAVELNQAIVDIHREVTPRFSKGLFEDPRFEVIVDEGRSALMRDERVYDVVQMTGIDTWTALTSGAYVLAENYLYTTEALHEMYAKVADGGFIQIIRMASHMETLRLMSNLYAATENEELASSVLALSGGILTATVIKKGKLTPDEVTRAVLFAHENGFIPVYMPGYHFKNPVDEFVRSREKHAFIARFPRDISATTDDRPYFFNFTRWNDPLGSARFIDEVASISQGNPLFILLQLAFSTCLAALFIIAPLLVMKRRRTSSERPRHVGRWLGFFCAIGAGFIAIEIGLMQKLTLVLGQPLYSLVVTLATLLVATGIGAWLSERLPLDVGRRRWLLPLAIAAMLIVAVLAGPAITRTLVRLPAAGRMFAAAALTAPMGILLGVPFAHGIRILRSDAPALIPWAWAVNGSATVVGSLATVVLSMQAGFNAVMLVAGAIYLLGFAALPAASARVMDSTVPQS